MKILVVGGSGMIGGQAAIHLQEQGNEVTIAARKAPAATTVACHYFAPARLNTLLSVH